jgi:hypothetical protein
VVASSSNPDAPIKPTSVLPPSAVLPPASAAHVYSLERQLGAFGNMVQVMQAHQIHKQDLADFEGVVGRADEMLKDGEFPVGKEYARRWLIAESQLHPELAAAFDNRNRSAEDFRRYQRIEKRAFDKLYKSAKAEPDPIATSDRRAVAAAMRGSSGTAPEAKPIRYGDLNDADFLAEKKKLGLWWVPDEPKGIDSEATLDREAIIRAMTRRHRKRKAKDLNNDNIASLTPGDIDPAR